jgi:hypothetical protein
MGRTTLTKNLAEAELCIAEGKGDVELQRAAVSRLTREGKNAKQAKHVLRTLRDTLAVFIEERDRLKRQLVKRRAWRIIRE